jgi:polyferredoxin
MNYPRNFIRYVRYAVQAAFLLLTLFIGWRFYQFVLHFESPGHPFVPRPESVDAFLPIGGLMAFKYFLFTGIVEPVHPAGFVLFVAICGVSLALKKGFCGWICPIGTVSQYVWMVGEKVFGRNFRPGKYTDIGLRALKYILLGFFILLIGIAMAPTMMLLFFITDYYKVVDVRMMKFFTEMSQATLWVLVALVVLSFLYKNFWCRYLCPYGALLGLLSKLSPVKVRRNDEKCAHCGACTKSCPTLIDVEKQEVVTSAECFGCMTCVSRCPSEGALDVSVRKWKGKGPRILRPLFYPALLIAFFYLVISVGMAAGKWKSHVPYEEYQRLVPEVQKEYADRK